MIELPGNLEVMKKEGKRTKIQDKDKVLKDFVIYKFAGRFFPPAPYLKYKYYSQDYTFPFFVMVYSKSLWLMAEEYNQYAILKVGYGAENVLEKLEELRFKYREPHWYSVNDLRRHLYGNLKRKEILLFFCEAIADAKRHFPELRRFDAVNELEDFVHLRVMEE